MELLSSYRMRLRRKRCHLRAYRRSRDLSVVRDRTRAIGPEAILLTSTLRNERVRLPYFLRYYRDLGVDHFLMVDNGSDDGSIDYLAGQPDVSIWATTASYKRAHFGVDWMNMASAAALPRALDADGRCRRIPRLSVLRYPTAAGADGLA